MKSSDEKQSTSQKTRKNNSLICIICGSPALGRNFGVIACESCKLFFRRNGLKDPVRNIDFHYIDLILLIGNIILSS